MFRKRFRRKDKFTKKRKDFTFYNLIKQLTPSLQSDTLDKAIENIKYLDNVTDEMRIRRTIEKNSPGLGLIFLSTAISPIK